MLGWTVGCLAPKSLTLLPNCTKQNSLVADRSLEVLDASGRSKNSDENTPLGVAVSKPMDKVMGAVEPDEL